MRPAVDFGRDVCGDLASANEREWLVTNGLGGYACGTIDGSLTRSYHGYLVAALRPPGERTLLFAKCEETCAYLGARYELSTNRWKSGAVAPLGYTLLERFFLDGTTPVWHYTLAGALVEKRVTLRPGANYAVVRYSLLRAQSRVGFSVRALVDRRDHHAVWSEAAGLVAALDERVIVVRDAAGAEALRLGSSRGEPGVANDRYGAYDLVRERERGLPDEDAHLHAATFAFELEPGEHADVWAAAPGAPEVEPADVWQERANHEADLLRRLPALRAPALRQLALAADQFVVARDVDGTAGTTVIAGYPWFTDWGRDTMIALPGLLLATGRAAAAKGVLLTFARYLDGGLIPNVFPDRGESPQYNTADAALWYVEAVRAYVAAAGIDDAFEALYAACVAIVDGYRRGTRYGIAMDPADALIAARESGLQLTWMDAKYDGIVVTPRMGKPVEINALWYSALRTLSDLTRRCGRSDTEYDALARRVRASFERYVLPGERGLADVLDGPAGDDETVRPNQIFAVALEHAPLEGVVARTVVDVCANALLTSHGLRSLAPTEPGYVGRYAGGRAARDGAYHQGTVWAWLLGPFARAYARAYDDAPAALALLQPLLGSLGAYGLGTLAEIADGDAPFPWKGAFAQAWSVAEVLATYAELDASKGWKLDAG